MLGAPKQCWCLLILSESPPAPQNRLGAAPLSNAEDFDTEPSMSSLTFLCSVQIKDIQRWSPYVSLLCRSIILIQADDIDAYSWNYLISFSRNLIPGSFASSRHGQNGAQGLGRTGPGYSIFLTCANTMRTRHGSRLRKSLSYIEWLVIM